MSLLDLISLTKWLLTIAHPPFPQADLRRPMVKEAMKIWGGEDTSHLSPTDMVNIQGEEEKEGQFAPIH